MIARRLVHTRSIRVEAYARDDGLWDIEARLTDLKARDFQLATGVRAAGDPVHDMTLRVTIDTQLSIVDAHAQSWAVPYPGYCDTIGPEYRRLIGLNLLRDFHRGVRKALGGAQGCTHLTELAAVLPTAAVQALSGEVFSTRDTSQGGATAEGRKPFQIDRCHALRSDGAAVAKFYPDWSTAAVRNSVDTKATD